MPLDQAALLELLEALKDTGVDDIVRQALQAAPPALIEAEAAALIGAASHERTPEGHLARRVPGPDADYLGRGPGVADS